jgi:cytochrome c biogenesis protein CcdA
VLAVSFVAAFVGGMLALLAPCSALLLPAFFAYAFANQTALLRGTLVFLLGLLAVLLPIGLAASLAGRLLIEQRQLTIIVSGSLLIVLGGLMALGRGFSFVPAVALPARGSATLVTGAVYGLTGFCSGPILGGVLTLAAVGQNALVGASLLVVYGVGMVAPLFALAVVWDRYQLGSRRWLRASMRRSTMIGAGLFIVLGASFIASQGGLLLSGAYADLGLSDLGFRLEAWLADVTCSTAALCA